MSDIYLVRAGAAVVSTLCENPVVEVVCAQKPRKRCWGQKGASALCYNVVWDNRKFKD
jgi:antitoxin (DNA-binding transcriptional repressor) of toxin-antitoxin stability system